MLQRLSLVSVFVLSLGCFVFCQLVTYESGGEIVMLYGDNAEIFPPDIIYAHVTVHKKDYYAFPDLQNPSQMDSRECTVTGEMEIYISADRIEYIKDFKNLENILTQDLQYPVASGRTPKDEVGMPDKILKTETVKIFGERFGKYLLEESYETFTESRGCDWTMAIHPYNPPSGNDPIAALSREYVITLSMADNFRFYGNPEKYYTKISKSGKKRIDMENMESFSENSDAESPMIPVLFEDRMPVSNSYESIQVLRVKESKELEDYLLNPEGSYILKLSGNKWRNDSGERIVTVDVTISFYVK